MNTVSVSDGLSSIVRSPKILVFNTPNEVMGDMSHQMPHALPHQVAPIVQQPMYFNREEPCHDNNILITELKEDRAM